MTSHLFPSVREQHKAIPRKDSGGEHDFFVRGHSCELNFLMTIMGCHILHLISFHFSFHNIEKDLMVQEVT